MVCFVLDIDFLIKMFLDYDKSAEKRNKGVVFDERFENMLCRTY